MLYALVGALEDLNWQEVARSQRGELVLALDTARELDKLTKSPFLILAHILSTSPKIKSPATL